MFVVRYEVHLEDGTLVAKSDGVEFTVSEGLCYEFVLCLISWSCDKDVDDSYFLEQVISVLHCRRL